MENDPRGSEDLMHAGGTVESDRYYAVGLRFSQAQPPTLERRGKAEHGSAVVIWLDVVVNAFETDTFQAFRLLFQFFLLFATADKQQLPVGHFFINAPPYFYKSVHALVCIGHAAYIEKDFLFSELYVSGGNLGIRNDGKFLFKRVVVQFELGDNGFLVCFA